jgi:very-short-patch-repair endonuclease
MLDTSESMSDISLYRLARREDALLQRNGYRILRILAEDVSERLDAVLGEIEMFWSPIPT